jgi:trk system potassium uptake protein
MREMYIIIIGCGRLGSTLATNLSSKAYDVVVVDSNGANLEHLGSGFNGQVVQGVEFDNDVLLEAGIDKADVFLAMTPDDNINIMAAQIAKDMFKVPRVIARIFDPKRELIYNKLGLETISPTELAADIVLTRITETESNVIKELDTNLAIVEFLITKSKNKTITEFEKKNECIISAVISEGKVMLPQKETILHAEDRIICTISRENRERITSQHEKERFI